MSDSSATQAASGGIGFGGLLCILFIGLKLTNHIDWSWVWVLSPIWMPLGLVVGVLFAVFIAYGTASIVRWMLNPMREKR